MKVAMDVDDGRTDEPWDEGEFLLNEASPLCPKIGVAEVVGGLDRPALDLSIGRYRPTPGRECQMHPRNECADLRYRPKRCRLIRFAERKAAHVPDGPLPAILSIRYVRDDGGNEHIGIRFLDADEPPRSRRPGEASIGQRCKSPGRRLLLRGGMKEPLHDGTLSDNDEFIRLIYLEPPLPSAALRMPPDHGERALDRPGIRLDDTAQQRLRSAVARDSTPKGLARNNAWHSV